MRSITLIVFFSLFAINLKCQLLGTIDMQTHQFHSFCEGKTNAITCFSDLLRHSEYIFEGTCIDSRFIESTDSEFYVESTYEIHKNFKKEINTKYVKLYAEATRPDEYSEKGAPLVSAQPGRFYRVLTKSGTTGIIIAKNASIRFVREEREDTNLQEIFILEYHLTQDTPEALLNLREIAFVRTPKRDFFKFSTTDQIYETILKTPGTELKNFTKKAFKKSDQGILTK